MHNMDIEIEKTPFIEVEKLTDEQQKINNKRKIITVDPETNEEIAISKRNKVDLDLDLKHRVLLFIANSLINIYTYVYDHYHSVKSGQKKPDMYKFNDLGVGSQCMSMLFIVHNNMRQLNGKMKKESTAMKKSAGYFTITIRGYSFKVGFNKINNIVFEESKAQNLEYKEFDIKSPGNWYGTCNPYMDFLAGYNLRQNELRLGHGSFILKKNDDGSDNKTFVNKYGFLPRHHVLLEGVSYPPEKRSSMAQSMGLGTVLIQLSRTRNHANYQLKWKSAAKRAIFHIPNCDEIITMISTKPIDEVRPLITSLCDLILFVSSREANRVFFNPCLFMRYLHPDFKKLHPLHKTQNKVQATRASDIDFSGKGAFCLYDIESKYEFEYCTKFDKKQLLGEMTFHSMFGTFKEDLSILEQISDFKTWHYREDYGDCFKHLNESETPISFKLPNFIMFSKLVAANTTQMCTSSHHQLVAMPVFSGRRYVQRSEEFFNIINEDSTKIKYGKSMSEIIAVLNRVKLEEQEKKRALNYKYVVGTVEWFEFGEHGKIETWKKKDNDIILETKDKLFLGPRI